MKSAESRPLAYHWLCFEERRHVRWRYSPGNCEHDLSYHLVPSTILRQSKPLLLLASGLQTKGSWRNLLACVITLFSHLQLVDCSIEIRTLHEKIRVQHMITQRLVGVPVSHFGVPCTTAG